MWTGWRQQVLVYTKYAFFKKKNSFLGKFLFYNFCLELSLKNFRPQEAFQAFRRISKPGFWTRLAGYFETITWYFDISLSVLVPEYFI